METPPSVEFFDTVDGDDILTRDAAKEIFDLLIQFADQGKMSLDELHRSENQMKRSKVLEIMKKNGTWNGQEIMFGDNYLIDIYLQSKAHDDDVVLEGNGTISETKGQAEGPFYTTDVVNQDELEYLHRKKPAFAQKILSRHFYELKDVFDSFRKNPDDPFSQGYPSIVVDNDLRYLSDLKERMDVQHEDMSGSSRDFEQVVAKGIAVGRWLMDDENELLDIGRIKHTTEYDDFINHSDYYCPIRACGKDMFIGFDATLNTDEDSILLKLDQGTSSQGIPPFGVNYVKYCYSEEDKELGFKEVKGLTKMPLYKISVDFDENIGIRGLEEEFGGVKESGMHALNYLRRVQNEKLLSEDEYFAMKNIIDSNNSFDPDFIQKCKVMFNKANQLKCLTTSFRVLSEIHEQNLLIIDKDKKFDNKKFRTRDRLTDADIDSVKKIDSAIGLSLRKCMKKLARFNGESDLINADPDKLYELFKCCSGVEIDNDEDADALGRGHNFGLSLYSQNYSGQNRRYLNMMNAIDAERSDIVYKEAYRNDRGGISISAHRYIKQLENTDSEKKLARDIFSSMALDSYLDNFEELFQIAKDTNSVKAFIKRLGKDDSEDDYGRSKVGQMKYIDDDGNEKYKTINTIGAKNHDDIILTLFSNEQDRAKYFSGRNGDYAASCLSDGFFENDDNIARLLNWNVSEGRLCYILSTRFGVSQIDAQARLQKVKSR